MKDVMIDFETFGNGKDKCLCQVGAVYFDRVTGELGAEFKANIDARTHVAAGGKIDAETFYWWLAQSDSARASVGAPGEHVIDVLNNLNDFLGRAERIWSHSTFDFVTLMDTLKQFSIKPQFSYKSGLDLRTLVYLAGTRVSEHVRDGTHHDGLEDAKFQVKYAVTAMNTIKGNKSVVAFMKKFTE